MSHISQKLKRGDIITYKGPDFLLTIKIRGYIFPRQAEGTITQRVGGSWEVGRIVNFDANSHRVTMVNKYTTQNLETISPSGKRIELNIRKIENA